MDCLHTVSSDTVLSNTCLVFGGSSTEIVWSRQGAGCNIAWGNPHFCHHFLTTAMCQPPATVHLSLSTERKVFKSITHPLS